MRGLPGNSVDRDRHLGFREVMEKEAPNLEIVEIVGNWDDGTSQKAAADALAVHGQFVAAFTQGGSTGLVRAFLDAGHPMVPMAGEGENGFRKYIAQYKDKGLKGLSYGQSPGLVAISMKAALAALEGNPMPQLISVPIPVRRLQHARGRQELLVGSHRQFLHAQRVPALRRQSSPPSRSWPRTRTTCSSLIKAGGGCVAHQLSRAFTEGRRHG